MLITMLRNRTSRSPLSVSLLSGTGTQAGDNNLYNTFGMRFSVSLLRRTGTHVDNNTFGSRFRVSPLRGIRTYATVNTSQL